jgi:hypothetical protein
MSGIIHTMVVGQWLEHEDYQGNSNPRDLLYSMLRYIYSHFVEGNAGELIFDLTAGLILLYQGPNAHFPNLTDSNDLYNVLALCNFCILANVLDRRTYCFPDHVTNDSVVRQRLRSEFDLNALGPSVRLQFSYFRGLALNLISWLNSHYAATDANTGQAMTIQNLASDYLRRQACCILNYKARMAKSQKGWQGCTVSDMRHQLDKLFEKSLLGLDATMLGEMRVGMVYEFHCKPTQYRIFASTSNGPDGELIPNNSELLFIYLLLTLQQWRQESWAGRKPTTPSGPGSRTIFNCRTTQTQIRTATRVWHP